ncbi:multidrug efflux protein [Vibrio cholerae]|uniref:Multidrug efflux protein n=1 Tax=Vibrio cholerae TaxID=666 RepID=A0A655QSF9_VIBCL|nr:multidrug efflux protein [Vibrio cholerae]
MALVPVVAQLNGAGRQHKIPFEVHQGLILALLVSVPIIAVLFQTQFIIRFMESLKHFYMCQTLRGHDVKQ